KRDDAGITEREIEREREQDGNQQFGAEPEIIRIRKVKGERRQPGQSFPKTRPMPAGQCQCGRMIGKAWRGCTHGCLGNGPYGRQSRNRMVSAKRNRVPPCGMNFFSMKSSTPISSAA